MQVSSLFEGDLSHQPKYSYIGVQVGFNPSSPIQQRRRRAIANELSDSSGHNQALQSMVLAGPKRRELLQQERPLRSASSRERLAIDFFRTGYLSFSCSITGDIRGLKLDAVFLSVFPSPDCHDRSACLFSYPYNSLNSCKATQNRLELRFKRAAGPGAAKQPTYLVFQSREAQYISEAVCYLKHGVYREVSTREQAAEISQAVARILSSDSTMNEAARSLIRKKGSDTTTAKVQTRLLTYIDDEESLCQRIDSRCRMIGCTRRCESSQSDNSNGVSNSNLLRANSKSSCQQHGTSVYSATSPLMRAGLGCLCDEHAAMVCGSPPKGSSRLKRAASTGFFSSKEKSTKMTAHSMVHLIQAGHFAKTLKYQGMLLKKPGASKNGNKIQVKKNWHQKLAVVIETPVGGFLCYYDKLSHCPGMTDTPKERRVIDLSAVLCIRPEASGTTIIGASGQRIYSFDVLTLYRSWTFASTDPVEYEIWLNVLTDIVENLTSCAPDKALRYLVKIVNDRKSSGRLSSRDDAILEISAYGVSLLTSGTSGGAATDEATNQILGSWYFTDIQKWSVAAHQGEQCCLLTCLSPSVDKSSTVPDQRPLLPATLSAPTLPISAPSKNVNLDVSTRYDAFLMQTADAPAICQAIEFYVGKCLAKLEVLTVEYMERFVKERETGVVDSVNIQRSLSSQTVVVAPPQRDPIERAKREQIAVTKPTDSSNLNCVASVVVNIKEHAVQGVQLAPIAVPLAPISNNETRTSLQHPDDIAQKDAPLPADLEAPDKARSNQESAIMSSVVVQCRAETEVTLRGISTTECAECAVPIELGMIQLEFMDLDDNPPEIEQDQQENANLVEMVLDENRKDIDSDSGLFRAEQEIEVMLESSSVAQIIDERDETDALCKEAPSKPEQDEELDRFHSFEYCICQVGDTAPNPVEASKVTKADDLAMKES